MIKEIAIQKIGFGKYGANYTPITLGANNLLLLKIKAFKLEHGQRISFEVHSLDGFQTTFQSAIYLIKDGVKIFQVFNEFEKDSDKVWFATTLEFKN